MCSYIALQYKFKLVSYMWGICPSDIVTIDYKTYLNVVIYN